MAESARRKWLPDPIAEQWLIKNGIKLKGSRLIPVAKIDVDASRQKNSRMDSPTLDQADISRLIANDMLDGFAYPMPVLLEMPDGNYETLGGLTRLLAAIALGDTHIQAIIVSGDTAPAMVGHIRRGLNTTHGVLESQSARANQAVRTIQETGLTADAVAKQYKVSADTVSRRLRVIAVRERARLLGHSLGDHDMGKIEPLHAISDTPPFEALVQLLVDYPRLSCDDVRSAIVRMKEGKNESAKLAIIARIREESAQTNNPKCSRSTLVQNLFRSARTFSSQLKKATSLGQMSTEQRLTFLSLCNEIAVDAQRLREAKP